MMAPGAKSQHLPTIKRIRSDSIKQVKIKYVSSPLGCALKLSSWIICQVRELLGRVLDRVLAPHISRECDLEPTGVQASRKLTLIK